MCTFKCSKNILSDTYWIAHNALPTGIKTLHVGQKETWEAVMFVAAMPQTTHNCLLFHVTNLTPGHK